MANQQKVAEIYASLVLQTAELKAGLNEANSEIKRFTAQTRAEMNEAKGAMALLGDEIGVRLPRHLRGFVAELPGVASAMSAAFNAIAVIGLISIVVEAGKKVYEFVEKTEEAAKKHAEAWQSTIQPINDTNDKLELTKTKLDNAIAKMEHKPQNKIKEAIEEATVAADELGRHLDTDIKRIADTLKGQEHNKVSQLLLHQTGGIGAADLASDVQDKFNQISAGTFKGTGDQTKDRDAVIQKAIDEAFEKLRPAQIMADRITANFGGKAPATSSSVQDVKAYTELIAGLKGLQTQSALTQGINTDKLQLGKDTDARDASDEHLKALEKQIKEEKALHEVSISQEALFWSRHIADFAKGSDQYDSVIEKASQANQKVLENYWSAGKLASAKKQWNLQDEAAPKQLGNTDSQGEKQLEQAQLRSAESQAKINAQYTIAVDRINLATGAISAHALSMDEAAAHALDYKQQLAALTAQLDELHKNDWMGDKANTAQEVGLQTQINSITNTAKIQEMQDAQNVLNTTWKGMIDSVFDEMIKKSQDTDGQSYNIQVRAVNCAGVPSDWVQTTPYPYAVNPTHSLYNVYANNPIYAVSNPSNTSIAMSNVTVQFASNYTANYAARTFSIPVPSGPDWYYVNVYDPTQNGESGPTLTANCWTNNSLVGATNWVYMGAIQAWPQGGSTIILGGGNPAPRMVTTTGPISWPRPRPSIPRPPGPLN
jgi:hypothetical protein